MCRYLLLVSMLVALPRPDAEAQNRAGVFRLDLVGTIEPASPSGFNITVIGSQWRGECRFAARDSSCSVELPRALDKVRIVIDAPGYRSFTQNALGLTYVDRVARYQLRDVQLTRLEQPEVVSVLAGTTRNGQRVFDLTLFSPLLMEIRVHQIEITSQSNSPGPVCSATVAEFQIADRINVSASGTGTLEANGQFTERLRGKDYAIDMIGKLVDDECSRSRYLSLTLPTSFTIPAKAHSHVVIRMPEAFAIRDSRYVGGFQFGEPSAQAEKPKWGAGTYNLSLFDRFTFSLSTDQKNAIDIEADYPVRPKQK